MNDLKSLIEMYLVEFAILVLQFLLPIFLMFAVLYFWKSQPFKNQKIKPRLPDPKFIWHEVKHTVISFFLLTFVITFDRIIMKKDFTKGYENIQDYGLVYFAFSIFALLFLYDLYFYVVHRILHHKKIYKFIHKTHHRSPAITPFGAFSVSFWEALFEFSFLPAMIFLIPLNVWALNAFLTIYILFNAYVHSGYEVLPKFWAKIPFKYINTAVHHDLHHSKLRYNFGLFTNIWDRIFKTQLPEYEEEFLKIKNKNIEQIA
jgi:Delta7-sterol 5-desaturase